MSKPRRKSQRPSAPNPPPADPARSSAPPSSAPKRKRKRRRAAAALRAPLSSSAQVLRPVSPLRALGGVLGVVLALLLLALSPLWLWSVLEGPGTGQAFVVFVKPTATPSDYADTLVARGALHSPRLFRAYVALLASDLELVPGEHLLNDAASPRQLLQRLARGAGRSSERVTLPEGFRSTQIGQRLEQAEVCTVEAFMGAIADSALLTKLGIEGASAEGYLFPASYGLLVDSDAREVVRVLVAETKKRMQKLLEAHPGRLQELEHDFGFHERDVLTLASMIEKEARAPEERPLIASVFFNRLRDPEFRPARMLQSDPTSSYGCWLSNPLAPPPSCVGYQGGVTPAMLRDAQNPYNTYRHAGLPPGPIASPGEPSIEAVLAPAQTEYLYFVAKGAGHHAFSRTFAEHREAVETPH